MVVGYKERQYSPPISCEIYRNLRTGSLSVRSKEGEHKGLVIDHLSEVHLKDCSFEVNENGRQKVIENERKNVHATVIGTLKQNEPSLSDPVEITYNPYEFDSFVTQEAHHPVSEAENVVINIQGERVNFVAESVTIKHSE
jgi:hypothetical protein